MVRRRRRRRRRSRRRSRRRRRRSSPQRFGCENMVRPNINFAVSGGAVINRRWRLFFDSSLEAGRGGPLLIGV